MDFLEKASFQVFHFLFGGLLIIWTTYSLSLASGKQFLPIENTFFGTKSKLLIFSKTTEERSKYQGQKLFRNEFTLENPLPLF